MPPDEARHTRSVQILVFLALAQEVASLAARALHEVVGHGLVAEVLGGEFILFYLSPLRAWAFTIEPSGAADLVRAGGVLAGFSVGLPLLAWLRKASRRREASAATRTLTWFFVMSTVVGGLAYMSGEPLVRLAMGGDATGDWDRIYRGLGVPLWIPFAVFGVAAAWAMARMMEEAAAIVTDLGLEGPQVGVRGPLRAFWTLWTPGLVFTMSYAATTWPWLTGAERSGLLGDVLAPTLLGLVGWAWLRLRRGPSRGQRAAPERHPRRGSPWPVISTGLLVAVAAVPLLFGPVESSQRGILIGRPDGDRYDLVAQSLDIEGRVLPGGRIGLDFRSRPLQGTGPAIRRRLTADLADSGPSENAAAVLSRFVATWNLDGATVTDVGAVVREGDAWTWRATVEAASDSVVIRLWPLTMFAESHIRTFALTGATRIEQFTHRAVVSEGNETLTWERGGGFDGIDSVAAWLR